MWLFQKSISTIMKYTKLRKSGRRVTFGATSWWRRRGGHYRLLEPRTVNSPRCCFTELHSSLRQLSKVISPKVNRLLSSGIYSTSILYFSFFACSINDFMFTVFHCVEVHIKTLSARRITSSGSM